MYRVYLGMGSNLGDRARYLQRALAELHEIVEIREISPVYESEAAGMESSNKFYNMAVGIDTPFNPPRLLHALKVIEKKLGRTPATHLKDREIDIDILIYENLYYEEHELQVPHPALELRRFALVPLNDIGKHVKDPFSGLSMQELLRKCSDTTRLEKTDVTLSFQP